ncbi:VOC family protein [Homoserinimonas sp. OAct 916]|uniref:VOC family protein n=1 Tax=Homoserinimonas sp. OAct 916 TaxID=2211450 RepID=UPI000DBE54B5
MILESKTVKNGLHLHLVPVKGGREDERARLVDYGAVAVADFRGKYGPGTGWAILAGADGNEFCILRTAVERSEI